MKTTLCLIATLLLSACAGGYAPSMASYDSNRSYGGEAAPKMASAEAEEAPGFFDSMGGDSDDGAYAPEPPPAPAEPTIKLAPREPAPQNGTPSGTQPEDKPTTETPEPPTTRIIIYTGDLGLYVYEVDASLERATALTREVGGWVQQSTSTSLLIRVPAARFEMVMAELAKLGDVSYRNVTGQDVTEEFYDLSIRLNNALIMRERYVELLKKATNVEDSLKIEQELGRITGEIEQIKGRLKFLKQHAAFSTITLQLNKKSDEPPRVTRVPLPIGWLQDYRLDSVFY